MKKAMFTKLRIVILLAGFLCFACAKTFKNENAVIENAPKPDPVTITIEMKMGEKIKARVQQAPSLNYSTELDSEEQLPELFAKFKDQLEKSEDSFIIIDSDIPVTIEKNTDYLAQARKTGAKTYYLKSEGQIKDWNLDEQDVEPPQNNLEKPDPFMLVVNLSKDGKFILNFEDFGTVRDLAPLENRLKDVFSDRKQRESELRKLTDRPLTTVYLLVPKETSPFDENLSRIIKSLENSGAKPIWIQSN